MAKGFYKSWGYSEKPCFVCGDKKKQNQFVQPSDRSFTGVLCPKCLFERIERITADADSSSSSGKDAGVDKPSVSAGSE